MPVILSSDRLETIRTSLRWLPVYACQRLTAANQQLTTRSRTQPVHLILALADHFEPSFSREHPAMHASREEQRRRVESWCRQYPDVVDAVRDTDGYPFRHTYFFPAEQYDRAVVEPLA